VPPPCAQFPKRIAAVLVLAGTLFSASAARAQICGDANASGAVTVTDAVQMLRAAAGLATVCSADICDMNLDGGITVTDGVVALRVVAQLETAPSCLADQARGVVERTQNVLQIGLGVLPSALQAAATVPCPDGGSSENTGNGLTDVDCRQGDFVSNGSVTFAAVAGTQDRQASFQGFSVQRLSTGETLVSSGTLTFSAQGSGFKVNGTVSRSSNVLGEFSDAFTDLVAAANGMTVTLSSGTVVTTVTHGIGAFAHLATLQANIVGPQLTIVLVTFMNSTQEVSIFADHIGLCDPCTTSSECNAQLACLPCGSGCTGTTHRCSVSFENFAAQCADGLF
jgi:hypothetical protein